MPLNSGPLASGGDSVDIRQVLAVRVRDAHATVRLIAVLFSLRYLFLAS